jgi:type IV pilus assembly protein PilM
MSAVRSPASGGWFASPAPPVAIEITAQRVSVVAVSPGASPTVTAQSSELLPDGLVTPAINATNVHDAPALAAAIRAAVDRISPRPRRAALLLPDTVAKVSILRFEKVPAKAQELEQLVRWQMRKTVPFRIEDAQVAWVDGAAAGAGRDFVVLAARRDVVHGYEQACEAAGVHAGIVDITSLNLVNAVLATSAAAGSGDDWLLVYVTAAYASIIVVRNGQMIFYRNRPAEAGGLDMGDMVHQTAMYFEDRLGGTAFGRVVLAGGSAYGADAERIRRQIEERLGARVEPLDVRPGVTLRDRITAGPDLLDAIAPAVGVLLRDRPARGGERVAS